MPLYNFCKLFGNYPFSTSIRKRLMLKSQFSVPECRAVKRLPHNYFWVLPSCLLVPRAELDVRSTAAFEWNSRNEPFKISYHIISLRYTYFSWTFPWGPFWDTKYVKCFCLVFLCCFQMICLSCLFPEEIPPLFLKIPQFPFLFVGRIGGLWIHFHM